MEDNIELRDALIRLGIPENKIDKYIQDSEANPNECYSSVKENSVIYRPHIFCGYNEFGVLEYGILKKDVNGKLKVFPYQLKE